MGQGRGDQTARAAAVPAAEQPLAEAIDAAASDFVWDFLRARSDAELECLWTGVQHLREVRELNTAELFLAYAIARERRDRFVTTLATKLRPR